MMMPSHQKDQVMIRHLELPASPPPSREGRGSGDWVNSQSCLCDEASIKICKQWGLKRIQSDEHMEVLKWWHACRAFEALHLFFIPYSMYFFIWLFIFIFHNILYNKLVNVSKCLSGIYEPFYTISNLGRGPSEYWFITGRSEVQVTIWDLWLVSEVKGSSNDSFAGIRILIFFFLLSTLEVFHSTVFLLSVFLTRNPL